jgi:diaminopimelate epimerase
VVSADLAVKGGRVDRVRLDLGKPVVTPPVEMPMTFPDTMYNVTRVAVAGAPHCVIFVPHVSDTLLRTVGPQIEGHPYFLHHPSVAFAQVNRRDDVTARVWRPPTGEAPSSAGAACAVVVAGSLSGRTQRQLVVHMPGGDVEVQWSEREDEHVWVAGPAAEVAQGEWPEGG